MSEAPKVSVVIANWNGARDLRICLPSLLGQSFSSLEIIVADNGSADDSADVVRQFGVRWLPLSVNLGLAPALNRGATVATGEYLLFVNNDMRFDPSFVKALVHALETSPTIFAADAMQFNWEGTFAGHLAAQLAKVKPAERPSAELVPGLHFYQAARNTHTRVFMASAACMLVRRSLFEQLRGFDDRLPIGYEDTDICWRAWLRGWETVYVPNAVCWHRVGATGHSKEGARVSFRGVLTGRLLLATKLLPARYMARTWLVSMAALGKDLGRFQWHVAVDRLSVLKRLLSFAPQLLRERRELFQKAAKSPQEHLNFLLQLTE